MIKPWYAQRQLPTLWLVLALVAGTATGARAATASWDPNTEPDLAGYKLSYGTQPGIHTVTIDVGRVTTYTFNPPAGTRYYVVVQAYSTTGALSAKSAEVTLDVPLPNRAPTLTQPANQSGVVDATVSLALTASDPEGTPLRFSASGLPPGLSIDSSSGVIAGVLLAQGSFWVSVGVTDGSLWAVRWFEWLVGSNPAIVVDVPALDTTLTPNQINNSADQWMFAYTWPANSVMAAILMKFNVAHIPVSATIQSAVLNLVLIGSDGIAADPNYTMSLHQVMTRNPDLTRATGFAANSFSNWTANQCCVNGVPMAQADISPPRSLTAIDRTVGFKTWDASAAVRSWVVSPESNFGLLLNADTTKDLGRFRVFSSTQDPVTARRPFLRVTYTVPMAGMAGVTLSSAEGAPTQNAYTRVSGDFDGDGRPDLATFRASSGEWRVWTSGSNFATHMLTQWGEAGDVAVPADYDGDGRTDIAIYRPSTGNWHIRLSGSTEPLVKHWGGSADSPVPLDHDGDGKADLALIGRSGCAILLSTTNYSTSVTIC